MKVPHWEYFSDGNLCVAEECFSEPVMVYHFNLCENTVDYTFDSHLYKVSFKITLSSLVFRGFGPIGMLCVKAWRD